MILGSILLYFLFGLLTMSRFRMMSMNFYRRRPMMTEFMVLPDWQ